MAKAVPRRAARIVNIAGIGPVLLERSARARRIIISVRPRSGVRVAVPFRVPFETALGFLELKKEWVCRHLARLEREESRRQALADYLIRIYRLDVGEAPELEALAAGKL